MKGAGLMTKRQPLQPFALLQVGTKACVAASKVKSNPTHLSPSTEKDEVPPTEMDMPVLSKDRTSAA